MKVEHNLCIHDSRNTGVDWITGRKVGRDKGCYCDNCFYGRSELAERILELEDYIDQLEDEVEGWRADNYDRQIGG